MERLTADLARVCEAQVRLFEPRSKKAPFGRYTFMTMAVGDGHGGLEHRNSTALLCRRDDLPFKGMNDTTEGYRNFLGLASHEYFHAWNVKRIKPAAFVPYDLTQENYTRLLWAFEGFTSYYDDLMLVRSGLLTEKQYLETLAKTFTTVMQRSSRLKQSVADSSFDAWIKYYRQDENAPNSVVSYYQKGSLVGLALDLTLRAETKGRVSLDDVMRALWRRARDDGDGYAGVDEDEFVEVAERVSGLALERRLREWTEGTRDPDFAPLLATFGVHFGARPAVDAPHFALLGVKTASSGTDCRLAHVFDGSPARRAGLSANDVLVALDGLRVTPSNLDGLLARYAAGDVVECLAFRRDELMRFEVRLATQPPLKYALTAEDKAPKAAQRLKAGWLGQR
jgi:predicted metalloprotease with PDZ domain